MNMSKIFLHRNTWIVFTILVTAGLIWQSVSHYHTTQALQAALTSLNVVSTKAEKSSALVENLKGRVMQLEAVEARSKDDIRNYILTYYKTVAPTIAEEIATKILEKSDQHNVPFVALVAMVEAESHFNPFSISPLKSDPGRGLLQVRFKRWADKLGLKDKFQLHDIETGIDSGAQILKELLDKNEGDMKKALWQYVGVSENVDVGNRYINKVYANMGKFTVFRSLANQAPAEEEAATPTKSVEGDPEPFAVAKSVTVDRTKSTGFVVHKIIKGDTLYHLASKYYGNGDLWKMIQQANPGVVPEKLVVGSELIIPNMYATGLIVPDDFPKVKSGGGTNG